MQKKEKDEEKKEEEPQNGPSTAEASPPPTTTSPLAIRTNLLQQLSTETPLSGLDVYMTKMICTKFHPHKPNTL